MDATSSLHIGLERHGDAAVARLGGTLDATGSARLRNTLLGCAAEQPTALVVDLDALTVRGSRAFRVFTQVRLRLSEWPGIPLLLVSAGRTAAGREPVHPSVADALAQVCPPVHRRRASVELPHEPGSARRGREFTRAVCRDWGLDTTRTGDALMVANELVDNVLVHTDSPAVLRWDLRETTLSVAVADRSPVRARMREGIPGRSGGLGLRLVAQLTTRWGCTPTLSGGKVVWGVFAGPVPGFARSARG